MLSSADARVARLEVRVDTTIPAKLIRSNGTSSSVTITNLSGRGLALEGAGDVTVGERVLLLLSSSQVHELEVRWAVGNHAGGQFID